VVVYTAKIFIGHLGAHLVVAFVEKVHQAADLQVVGPRELLQAYVEVYLPLPIV
jgi:hypothetical protein